MDGNPLQSAEGRVPLLEFNEVAFFGDSKFFQIFNGLDISGPQSSRSFEAFTATARKVTDQEDDLMPEFLELSHLV